MNKLILTFLVFISIFLIGCSQTQEMQKPNPNTAEIEDTKEMQKETTPKENLVEETQEENMQEKTEQIDGVTAASVTMEEFLKHNTPEDCWIIYEGKIYDYTDAPRHPKMDETFFKHCGKPSGFEQGAKSAHKKSSEERVANYGTYVGYKG